MGVLERKIQSKLEEQNNTIYVVSQVNPKVQKSFSLIRERTDKYIDKFYEIAKIIEINLQTIPSHYNLTNIPTKLDQMIEDLKELRQVYLNAENGMIELKLAFIKESEATKIPTAVWNIRNSIAMLFSLLKNMQLDSQKLLNSTNFIKGSDEDKRKLRWEIAYLSNFAFNNMKDWASVFNDRNVWIQAEDMAETKVFPIETTKALEPEEKDTVREQAQPVLRKPSDPSILKRRTKQDWTIGSWVNVGFLKLKVIKIYPPKMVYPKTTYLLKSKTGKLFYFEPYKGLSQQIDPKDI